MDIDILSVGDLLHLIEGYYCYSPIKEDAEYLQNLLLTLIEFHGTDDTKPTTKEKTYETKHH